AGVDRKLEGPVIAGHVAQPDLVGIPDRAVREDDVDRVSHGFDGEGHVAAERERRKKREADTGPEHEVEDDTRPQDAPPDAHGCGTLTFALAIGEGDVVDETPRPPDLPHHLVTGVDAERAGDAAHLLAVADIDAGGTAVDASHAVDAVGEGNGP